MEPRRLDTVGSTRAPVLFPPCARLRVPVPELSPFISWIFVIIQPTESRSPPLSFSQRKHSGLAKKGPSRMGGGQVCTAAPGLGDRPPAQVLHICFC